MIHRVLVPTDFSECAERAHRFVLEGLPKAEIKLLHVIDDYVRTLALRTPAGLGLPRPSDEALLAAYEEEAQARLDALGGGEVRYGEAANATLVLAREWHADLIALGTHGRRGLDRLILGSVAEKLVRESLIPVLTVRVPPGPHAR